MLCYVIRSKTVGRAGRKQFAGLHHPQFGEPGYDETKLVIRVDCVEGDEEKMEDAQNPWHYLYQL